MLLGRPSRLPGGKPAVARIGLGALAWVLVLNLTGCGWGSPDTAEAERFLKDHGRVAAATCEPFEALTFICTVTVLDRRGDPSCSGGGILEADGSEFVWRVSDPIGRCLAE